MPESQEAIQNVAFADFCALLDALGFSHLRTAGSHRIYTHPDVSELVNVQDVGGEAKPYQIRQVKWSANALLLDVDGAGNLIMVPLSDTMLAPPMGRLL